MFSCSLRGEHMKSRVFERVLEYAKISGAVNVVGGEPFMHPQFGDFLTRVSKETLFVRLVTNGSFIMKKKRALQKLIAAANTTPLLVRISNDRWHKRFIRQEEIEKADLFLSSHGVNVIAHPNGHDEVIYPLGRALKGPAWDYILNKRIVYEPSECRKMEYDPWDNISIDVNGNVSPCCHHQAICGNILTDDIDTVVKKAERLIKTIMRYKPINAFCQSCHTYSI